MDLILNTTILPSKVKEGKCEVELNDSWATRYDRRSHFEIEAPND